MAVNKIKVYAAAALSYSAVTVSLMLLLSWLRVDPFRVQGPKAVVNTSFDSLGALDRQKTEGLLQFFAQSAEWNVKQMWTGPVSPPSGCVEAVKLEKSGAQFLKPQRIINSKKDNSGYADVQVFLCPDQSPAWKLHQSDSLTVSWKEKTTALRAYRSPYRGAGQFESKLVIESPYLGIVVSEYSADPSRKLTQAAAAELSELFSQLVKSTEPALLLPDGSKIAALADSLHFTPEERGSVWLSAIGYVNPGEPGVLFVEQSSQLAQTGEGQDIPGWSNNPAERFYYAFPVVENNWSPNKGEIVRRRLMFRPLNGSAARELAVLCRKRGPSGKFEETACDRTQADEQSGNDN